MTESEGGPEQVTVVFSTAGRDQGPVIARLLVERHLAACVNITGVRSYYRWQGEMCDDEEVLLIIKTTRGRLEELMAAIRAVHTYDLPEMIAIPACSGYPPYLEWVREETRG